VVRRLLRGLLQRREVVAGPRDERLGLGNVGDAEHRRAGHPGLEDAGGQPPALLMTEQPRLTDARSAPLGGREGRYFAGDGAAVDADGAGDAHRHLDRADHVLDGGLGGLRGEAVVPDRVERRAGLRLIRRRAVGAPRRRCRRRRALREFVEAEVALPNAVCEGRGVCHAPTFPAPALKRSACSFLRYPLILWITVLPPLSELIPPPQPNDRAQRVSERGSGRAPNTQTASRALADSLMQLARQVSRLESGQ